MIWALFFTASPLLYAASRAADDIVSQVMRRSPFSGRAYRKSAADFSGAAEKQHGRGRNDQEDAEDEHAGGVVAGLLAGDAEDHRAGEAAEIADRVDQRDSAGGRRAAQECRGQRVERPIGG